MSPQFDVRWLSLSVDSNDGLNEAVAAEKRPAETVTDDGRFEALLSSHLRWATRATNVTAAGNNGAASAASTGSTADSGRVTDVPGDFVRSTRIAKEVSEQLGRIAQVGVAA